jgi:hypothetical protein
MLQNEALSVEVPTEVYVELLFQLRKHDDTRQPAEVLPLAIKAWLASYLGNPSFSRMERNCARAIAAPITTRRSKATN